MSNIAKADPRNHGHLCPGRLDLGASHPRPLVSPAPRMEVRYVSVDVATVCGPPSPTSTSRGPTSVSGRTGASPTTRRRTGPPYLLVGKTTDLREVVESGPSHPDQNPTGDVGPGPGPGTTVSVGHPVYKTPAFPDYGTDRLTGPRAGGVWTGAWTLHNLGQASCIRCVGDSWRPLSSSQWQYGQRSRTEGVLVRLPVSPTFGSMGVCGYSVDAKSGHHRKTPPYTTWWNHGGFYCTSALSRTSRSWARPDSRSYPRTPPSST